MKKKYITPKLDAEIYQLSESIASNCDSVVKPGPEMGSHSECEGYVDPFEVQLARAAAPKYNVQFYEDTNCDCYTTSDKGAWTS